jgi:hypothetical protein
MADIETPRLLLRLIAPEAMRATVSGDSEAIGASLAAGVPPELWEDPAVFRYAVAELEVDTEYRPWQPVRSS